MPDLGWLYFSLRGRCTRMEFWLLHVVPFVLIGLIVRAVTVDTPMEQAAWRVLILALLWPSFAVQVKRWHDVNKSAWWVLINLLPFFGWLIALVENGLTPGDPGANRYGLDPLGRIGPVDERKPRSAARART